MRVKGELGCCGKCRARALQPNSRPGCLDSRQGKCWGDVHCGTVRRHNRKNDRAPRHYDATPCEGQALGHHGNAMHAVLNLRVCIAITHNRHRHVPMGTVATDAADLARSRARFHSMCTSARPGLLPFLPLHCGVVPLTEAQQAQACLVQVSPRQRLVDAQRFSCCATVSCVPAKQRTRCDARAVVAAAPAVHVLSIQSYIRHECGHVRCPLRQASLILLQPLRTAPASFAYSVAHISGDSGRPSRRPNSLQVCWRVCRARTGRHLGCRCTLPWLVGVACGCRALVPAGHICTCILPRAQHMPRLHPSSCTFLWAWRGSALRARCATASP